VICGREDQIVDPQHVQEAVEGLPNFRMELVPRCGHAPQLEAPHIINPLVVKFLQEDVGERRIAEPSFVAAEPVPAES
jgi:pimeloyl-ACP methyl ester carboxylesterase